MAHGIRKQLLTTIFDLPVRIVNAFPRPLRDAINKLKQPFRDGFLDIYSQCVYEMIDAYEAYNNEKLERQRRAEKRASLVRGQQVSSPQEEATSSVTEEDDHDEDDETEEEDDEDDDDEQDEWSPDNDANIAVAAPKSLPLAPPSPKSRKTRRTGEFQFIDFELPPPLGQRKRGRKPLPKTGPANTSFTFSTSYNANKKPKDKQSVDQSDVHYLGMESLSPITEQLNLLRRQLSTSLLVLETIQLKYEAGLASR